VLCGALPQLAERLAWAGFAAVALEPRASRDLEVVLEALRRGALGVAAEERFGVLITRAGAQRVAAPAGAPWLVVRDAPDEREVDTIVQWLARHLV
jgi:hypothetical protein